jgi:hypothetical protein
MYMSRCYWCCSKTSSWTSHPRKRTILCLCRRFQLRTSWLLHTVIWGTNAIAPAKESKAQTIDFIMVAGKGSCLVGQRLRKVAAINRRPTKGSRFNHHSPARLCTTEPAIHKTPFHRFRNDLRCILVHQQP